MAILTECDICGAQHRVKDAWIGQVIRCRECGVQIGVPKDQFISPEAFVEEDGRLRRREPEPATSYLPWIVATLVSGVIAASLVGSVWAISMLVSGSSTPSKSLNVPIHCPPVPCHSATNGIEGEKNAP